MRTPIKEIEIERDDEAHSIMQVAQRLPPQYTWLGDYQHYMDHVAYIWWLLHREVAVVEGQEVELIS